MRKLIIALSFAPLFVASLSGNANAVSMEDAKALYDEKLVTWINQAVVLDSIKAQNDANAGLTQDDVLALDHQWRGDDASLIDPVLSNDLSAYLKTVVEESEGLYGEVFVMDSHGLNVGQSAKTSDYWQGDEAKFTESYGKGLGGIHVGEVEFDESSQTYLVQMSFTISEGEQPIGAITIGVDAEMIE